MSVGWYLAAIAGTGLTVWVVSLLTFPGRPCMWCAGEGCRMCGQTGRRARPGAVVVARLAGKVSSPWRGRKGGKHR